MGDSDFALTGLDYLAFAGYFVALCGIGLWVGRKRKAKSDEYFLAGRSLPWYVVGTSFIASNISSEHFIGMVGVAFVYGLAIAPQEWGSNSYISLILWFFIPFLLASRVFTIPEFLERRFNSTLRSVFAVATIVSNVVAFLAAVLYGGGLALNKLFNWDLWMAIILLAVVAGSWAIYGGLKSVAWTDFFTLIVMILGGVMVTVLGLYAVSGDAKSIWEGLRVTFELNRAQSGIWAEAVAQNAQNVARVDEYNRLAIIQPITHQVMPWPHLVFSYLSIGVWYGALNQFMIQRVLGAKSMYHARMGMVLAGFMKLLMPVIVVLPGLILFARYPEVMLLPWDEIRPRADQGYVHMIQTLIPAGLRGVLLAALFGAIQSTVNSVLNSTSTVFTLDIWKRHIRPDISERQIVQMGMLSSVVILLLSILLAGNIARLGGSLFVYIQTLYNFFGPPFSAIFLTGLVWRRINARGAVAGVLCGFVFGILLKVYVNSDPNHALWVEPYSVQGILIFAVSVVVCFGVSLLTLPPRPDQVTRELTFQWGDLRIFTDLGDRWYSHVVTWWLLAVSCVIVLYITFSGYFF